MTGKQLQAGRKQKGWNQQQAALTLQVSQPYLSLLERGERPVTEKLADMATWVYGLSPVVLPLMADQDQLQATDESALAVELAALGYPGLTHLKGGRKKNPAEVLCSALCASNLDSRLIEALPWVLLHYPNLDWTWLIRAAKLNDLQNRLGFITSVARRIAARKGLSEVAGLLSEQESVLERSRLVREDTLCHDSLTRAERLWLRRNRPAEAKHWRLLTDLSPDHLNYDH